MAEKIKKERIDKVLVDLGLESTRTRAQARIMAGDVLVNEVCVDKPGTKIDLDSQIRFKKESLPYVSRGGLKLAKGLELWPIEVNNTTCLDIGSSTGGFTDVLLQNGASKVYAIDVGTNQLAYKLRIDDRIDVREKTHILSVTPESLDPRPSIVVSDVSFISLTKIIPHAVKLAADKSFFYFLIKPQFEVGREQIAKGGIVKDEAARLEALNQILACAQGNNLTLIGHAESPIKGTEGNIEYISAFSLKKLESL